MRRYISEETSLHGGGSFSSASNVTAKGAAPVMHSGGLLRRKYSVRSDLESSDRDLVVHGR
jgi:hypothetical protein